MTCIGSLTPTVIGTAPTVLNANWANQKKFDESLLAPAGHEIATSPDEHFLWSARDATRTVLIVGSS
jgi:hypothetical protein